jgi:hypothetical protein
MHWHWVFTGFTGYRTLPKNMAGGDSSARGMFLRFLLGADHEPGAIPENWLKEMIHTQEIDTLLG